MDISRRKALGLLGLGGGVGLAGCASSVGEVGGGNPIYIPDVAFDVTFDHGVASGDATSEQIVLWSRVTPVTSTHESFQVRGFISTNRELVETYEEELPEGFHGGQVFMMETGPGRDFTLKHDVGMLTPDTVYYYRFAVKTPTGIVQSPVGKTRTLPASGGEQLRAAVVSCSNWPFGYFNVYKAIAERDDVDVVMHLGDYIYEYGRDSYGGEVGAQIGREHLPAGEIITLADYRMRHAQYKSDPDTQAAHAAAPWYCTWDDHESTNNSYRSGAQNHNPDEGEGDWTVRKQLAVQAYMEWMPVRDLEPGRAAESIYRKVDFGDLATFFMLESRLTGRSDEIDWGAELFGVHPNDVPAKAMEAMAKVSAPERTMLGQVQENWLEEGMAASVESGKTWQLLVNQVILAKVVPPDFENVLSEEDMANLPGGYAALLGVLAKLGLPFNLDAWDGFPAARERLFASAKKAGARLVTVTGDTHTAWANMPMSDDGAQMGVEFGCTSVTSPGLGGYLPFEDLGKYVADANESVAWYDPFGHGFTLLTLTPEKAVADFYKVSTVMEKEFATEKVASFEADAVEGGTSPLRATI